MLFSNYLEEVMGSKVKVKILRALFRFQTKTFTSRELANHIRVSHTAVLKSLEALQGMNIIKIESHGTSNLITLNQESYLYDELKRVFDFEFKTLQNLKEEIKKALPKAKSIALFGSIAQKKEKINSDIDILIITKNKAEANEIITKKQELFSKKFGNIISANVMTEKEFKRKRNTAFVKDLLKNYVLIKGDKL
jgi:predicted nucleotidyltransferase